MGAGLAFGLGVDGGGGFARLFFGEGDFLSGLDCLLCLPSLAGALAGDFFTEDFLAGDDDFPSATVGSFIGGVISEEAISFAILN